MAMCWCHGACSLCRSKASLSQAVTQRPHKLQPSWLKSITGKPPSPCFSTELGQAWMHCSQRVQAAKNCASGWAHGGRKGAGCGLRPRKKPRRGREIGGLADISMFLTGICCAARGGRSLTVVKLRTNLRLGSQCEMGKRVCPKTGRSVEGVCLIERRRLAASKSV